MDKECRNCCLCSHKIDDEFDWGMIFLKLQDIIEYKIKKIESYFPLLLPLEIRSKRIINTRLRGYIKNLFNKIMDLDFNIAELSLEQEKMDRILKKG